MTDSDFKTGSSPSLSALPWDASLQTQDEQAIDAIHPRGIEHNPTIKDATADTSPSMVSNPDSDGQALRLEWQDREHVRDHRADDRDDIPYARKPRLIDFVVIPGIYGRWDNGIGACSGSGNSAWVLEFARERLPRSLEDSCRVFQYQYDSSEIFCGRRSRKAIHQIALKLLWALHSKRRQETKKRLIYFITHDIGGIIVKDALVTAALEPHAWKDILEMARVLVFNGCPHRNPNPISLKDRISYFLFESRDKDHSKFSTSASSISGISEAVLQINGLFIDSKIPLRSWVISIYSNFPGKSTIHPAFGGLSGTMGFPLEKRMSDPSELNYWPLKRHLHCLEHDIDQKLEPSYYRCERSLLALASPIYPPKFEMGPNPLDQSPQYQAWLHSSSCQILYIHGDHNTKEVADRVFYSLEGQAQRFKRRAIVLYFSFDRYDIRRDSVRDMLATFVAQIATHFPNLSRAVETFFKQLHTDHGWTEKDLIQYFERFRIMGELKQTMVVVNSFDECAKDSRRRFLNNIIYKYHNSEAPWKIVVTSHNPGALSDELSDSFCVPIDLLASDPASDSRAYTDIRIQYNKELLRILRPDLNPQKQKVHEELLFISKLEPLVQHVIYEQIQIRDEWPETSIQELFGALDLTQGGVEDGKALIFVLDWVLERFPDQAMLRRLLSWLLYAVRPLTIWELATVLSPDTDQDQGDVSPNLLFVESLIPMIQRWLAGIIEVEHNEVKFQSPKLHSLMLPSGDSRDESAAKLHAWDEVKDKAQFEITSFCFGYLARASVQEYIKKTFHLANSETFEAPSFLDRTNIASYSIQAWMYHYSLSTPRPDLSGMTSHAGLVQTLARAHWTLANPITRSATCLETLFPIFAGMGLNNAIKPLNDTDAFHGLLEASRKGQDRVVRDLTEEYTYTESQLWEALKAASSSGNEEMMLGLLDSVLSKVKNPTDIQWPSILIHRAAFLDLDRFAEKILTLGCHPDPDVEWMSTMQASPLLDAISNGHVNTVRALLKHGASDGNTDDGNRKMLQFAAAKGHAEVLRVIVEEGEIDVDFPLAQNVTALYHAVGIGNHKAAKQLLDMGSDPNMGVSPESTNSQPTPLVVASGEGNKRCVRLLLDRGADLNICGRLKPPLQWAASKAHLEILDMLLAAGANPRSELIKIPLLTEAIICEPKHDSLPMIDRLLGLGLDVNAKDINGKTALLHATQSYTAERIDGVIYPLSHQMNLAIRKLLDHGADPNISDSAGVTPLHGATSSHHYNLVEMLLEADANPNHMSNEGTTPLFAALRFPEITRLLLEKGANPDLGRSNSWTNLTFAANSGFTKVVELLLEHGASIDLEYGDGVEDVEDTSLKGWTPLMCAASKYSDIVRILAEAGANMQHQGGQFKESVLHLAAVGQTLPAVLEFSSRIDVNQTDIEGCTALHMLQVSFYNFKRLVNAGADIEAETDEGDTPLTIAASSDLERTKYLINKGANINHLSPLYGAALHQACKESEFGIMKFLVENGADINQICDSLLGTPLQALCLRNLRPFHSEPSLVEKMFRYLLDEDEEHPKAGPKNIGADVTVKGGMLGFAINAAALSDTPNIINLILEQKGATVDVRNDMGHMPIHFAAFNGMPNFEIMLDKGGDIWAKDKLGRTALHWAAYAGRFQVVEKIISLLDDKTAVDAPDIDGWTPLCWAARRLRRRTPLWLDDEGRASEPSTQTGVIRLLLKNGADPTVVASVGDEKWTPLKIARYHRCSSQVLSMLTHDAGFDPSNVGDEDEKLQRTDSTQQTQGEEEAMLKTGILESGWFCNGCLSTVAGFFYTCKTCPWCCFCFKCYLHATLMHSVEHDFEQQGGEGYEGGKRGNTSSTSSNSSDSSDSDSDSTTGSDASADS